MFNQLLVLGLVPGTDVQITFSELLMAAELALVGYLLREKLPVLRAVRRHFIYFRLYLSVKMGQKLILPTI
jgi:hypothetical protein